MRSEPIRRNVITTLKLRLAEMLSWARGADDISGVAAVEFALVVPMLLLTVVGGLIFSIAFSNYLMVTNAADVGAMQLVASRGGTTPFTDTVSSIKAAAPTLTPASLTITLRINGVTCTSDSTCQTALTAGVSKQATVSVSYPCDLNVMGTNFAPSGCTLSSTTIGRVQ